MAPARPLTKRRAAATPATMIAAASACHPAFPLPSARALGLAGMLGALALLAGCVGGSPQAPGTRPASHSGSRSGRAPGLPPAPHRTPPPAPRLMTAPGLEGVIGAHEDALIRQFGQPRLNVEEGDARKLQFSGNACVLDIYLYPLSPGQVPEATYVEARRATDAREVDRAACVAALRERR